MADKKLPSKGNILELANNTYGTKPTVMYLLRKAREASKRVSVDIAAQNVHAITADSQQMIDAIDDLWTLLGDDKAILNK